MQRVMQALRAEHHRLSKVLQLLEQQAVDLLHNQYVDYDRTRRIAVYCDDYVTQLHHPLEELLIARLVARAPEAIKVVQPLLEQHGQLALETDELLQTTELLLADAPMARTDLAERLRRFVRHNADHRDYEERELFPLAERILVPSDWEFLARFRRLERRIDLEHASHHGHADLEQLLV